MHLEKPRNFWALLMGSVKQEGSPPGKGWGTLRGPGSWRAWKLMQGGFLEVSWGMLVCSCEGNVVRGLGEACACWGCDKKVKPKRTKEVVLRSDIGEDSICGFECCLGALWVVITLDCVVLSVTSAEFGQRSRAAIGKISGSAVFFTYLNRNEQLVCENWLGTKKRSWWKRRQGLTGAVESMCSIVIGRVGMETKMNEWQSK